MSLLERWLARTGLDRPDAKLFAYLPILVAVSWAVPCRAWPRLSSRMTDLPWRLSLHGPTWDDIQWPGRADPRARARLRVEQHLRYLRDLRPGGWRPTIRVVNLEALSTSQAVGKGVVLWVADTYSAPLVVKKALYNEGYRVHHLSRPTHGGSSSPMGIRYLNGIVRLVEDRYLEERVTVSPSHEFGATAKLLEVLSRGGIVSITAGHWGRQVQRLPFRGGRLPIASGAPGLAHASGASLLPVFCIDESDNGTAFAVTIDRPLPVNSAAQRSEAVKAAMEEFLVRHELCLGDRLDQWRGFEFLSPPG